VLFDAHVHQNREPCGFCLCTDTACQLSLVKKHSGNQEGQKIDMKASSCPKLSKMSYKSAAEYKPKSPCTNVPVYCPLCSDRAPAIWKYNLEAHLRRVHPDAEPERYKNKWFIGDTEKAAMQTIWDRICKPRASKGKKRAQKALAISEGHASRLALRSVLLP
jgi:hypothetical protein